MDWLDEVKHEMTLKKIHKNLTETVSDSEVDEIVAKAFEKKTEVEAVFCELVEEETRNAFLSSKRDLERRLEEQSLLDTYCMLNTMSKKELARLAISIPDALMETTEEMSRVHNKIRPFLTKFAERWREENS